MKESRIIPGDLPAEGKEKCGGTENDLLGVAVGYRFNETFAMETGVRYLSVDYSDGGFLYDVDTTGIMLGAAFSF